MSKVTKHLVIVDDLYFKSSNKIFLKPYLENYHERASLNTKNCCGESYHRLEVGLLNL